MPSEYLAAISSDTTLAKFVKAWRKSPPPVLRNYSTTCTLSTQSGRRVVLFTLSVKLKLSADNSDGEYTGIYNTSSYVDVGVADLFACVFPEALDTSVAVDYGGPPYAPHATITGSGVYTAANLPKLIQRLAELTALFDVITSVFESCLAAQVVAQSSDQPLTEFQGAKLWLAVTDARDPGPASGAHALCIEGRLWNSVAEIHKRVAAQIAAKLTAVLQPTKAPQVAAGLYSRDTGYVRVFLCSTEVPTLLTNVAKYISDVEDANRHGALSPDDPGSLL